MNSEQVRRQLRGNQALNQVEHGYWYQCLNCIRSQASTRVSGHVWEQFWNQTGGFVRGRVMRRVRSQAEETSDESIRRV